MKKIVSTLLALALVISAVQSAQAAQISTSGYFMITSEAIHNQRLLTQDPETTLKIYERVELALDMNLGEDVYTQLSMRIPSGELFYGNSDTSNFKPELRSAYIDFPAAMFDIRAGLQGYTLPGYLGSGVNPIMDDVFAGFVLSADFGFITPELAWFVPSYTSSGKSNIYNLTFGVNPTDNIDFKHWFMLDDIAYEGETSNLYIGVNLDMAINDISLGAGCIYAKKDKVKKQNALLVEGHIAFDLAFMTPGLAAWYGKQGDVPMVPSDWGSWGAFNGSADSFYANGNGLQDVFPVNYYDPFNTTGIYFSLADIALNNSISLAGHALYVIDNTLNSSESELELGANVYTSITNNLDFIIDAYYFMPMYKSETGNGALVACTLQANF